MSADVSYFTAVISCL